MTLVQLQLGEDGPGPHLGHRAALHARAVADKKPIHGLETLREQLSMLAGLPDRQQREFLLYSIDDADRMAEEIDELLSSLAAWRQQSAGQTCWRKASSNIRTCTGR